MDSQSHLLLKRAVNVKVIVTDRWKTEVQQQLQDQINQRDAQLQQLEGQGQRMVGELQKQNTPGNEGAIAQQLSNLQGQINQEKSKILEQKNQVLQQLQQVQLLEMGQEVNQGQLEGFFRIEQGQNLIQKMQVEILLEDGVVKEIRGEL
jgi:exonuclease VII large subunit